MTRITSLDTLVGTATIDIRSAFLLVGNKKTTPLNLGNYANIYNPAGKIEGAMYTQTVSQTPTTAAWRVTTLSNLAYDNTSWTNANSIGIFQVPTDEYRFVEVSWLSEWVQTAQGDFYNAIIDPAVNANPQSNTRICPAQSGSCWNDGIDRGIVLISAVYLANSGDFFAPSYYLGSTNEFWPSSIAYFSIRGIR